MAIKATFPTGVDTVTTNKSLHQWDYGQQLEIEAVGLSPIIEVHFACHGMTEAEVRPCSSINGIATVTIPDRCLEQPSNITAWVFEIDGTRGMTTKTITIPVKARTKPSKSGEIPQEFKDCYTELISEVNEAIKYLSDGDVVAKYADSAGNATSANTAGHANTAVHANTADSATSASYAVLPGKKVFDGVVVIPFSNYDEPNELELNISADELLHSLLVFEVVYGDFRYYTPPVGAYFNNYLQTSGKTYVCVTTELMGSIGFTVVVSEYSNRVLVQGYCTNGFDENDTEYYIRAVYAQYNPYTRAAG